LSLFIMRHGQTAYSAGRIYSGSREVPLTDLGREQAERAGELLTGSGIDAILCSPLGRARDTAEAVSAAIGVPARVDDRLCEVGYGPLEGLDRAGAAERFGDAYERWRERPFEAELPGMEPLEQGLARAGAAAEDAIAAHSRPLLVAHQGILRLVLIAIGDVPRDDYFKTVIPEAEPLEVGLDRS
jgi:broad specificity phosphatase PhoE